MRISDVMLKRNYTVGGQSPSSLAQESQLQSEQRGDPHSAFSRLQMNHAFAKPPLILPWLTERDGIYLAISEIIIPGDTMWNCSPWALLPPVYSLFTAAGLWVVYFVAVNDKQIVPLSFQGSRVNKSRRLPYISIAGDFPPASCIFSEVMNLAGFVGLIIAILRYLQLKHTTVKPWLNISSLVVFSISCFGMTLVGNVQLSTGRLIHELGTSLTFGLGTLICWVQSCITLKVDFRNEGRKVAIIRFLLSGAATVSLFIRLLRMMDDLQGVRCQWALVMFFLAFICTFAIEFRHSRFGMVCTDNIQTHSEM